MPNKTSTEVVKVVIMWIMHFGPPKVLQSDNGTEFKGVLTLLLHEHGIKVIIKRPRHPQSQGMVEQANGVLKEKIGAWCSDHLSSSWVSSLPEVIAGMKSQRSSVTGKLAYISKKYTLQLVQQVHLRLPVLLRQTVKRETWCYLPRQVILLPGHLEINLSLPGD